MAPPGAVPAAATLAAANISVAATLAEANTSAGAPISVAAPISAALATALAEARRPSVDLGRAEVSAARAERAPGLAPEPSAAVGKSATGPLPFTAPATGPKTGLAATTIL